MKREIFQQKKKVQRKNPQFEAMKRKRKMTNLSSYLSSIGIKAKTYNYIFLALGGLILIILLMVFIFRNNQYAIKNVEVYGNTRISTDSLNEFMSKYIDQNLVSLSKGEVLSEISNEFVELEDINLIKVYPDSLKVEVIETLPSLVYFDLDSTELISRRGEIVGIIDSQSANLTDDEVEIARGGGDPNADYVRSKLQGEKEGAFVWDEVPQEERLQALSVIRVEIDSRVNDFVSKTIENIKNTTFKDLIIIYRKSFISESLSENDVTFTLKIADDLNLRGMKISKVALINKFDLSYELEDGKSMLFTTRRDINLQIKDLDTIISNSQMGQGTVYDFRSSNFSIK